MTLDDPDFGRLTWSDTGCFWQGTVRMPGGESLELMICTPADSQPRAEAERNPDRTITPEARNAFRMLLGMTDKIKQKATDDYLPVYNKTWNVHAKPPLSAAEFTVILEFESVSLNRNGTFDVYLIAGDLFTDHAILIHVDADGGMPYRAKLEG